MHFLHVDLSSKTYYSAGEKGKECLWRSINFAACANAQGPCWGADNAGDADKERRGLENEGELVEKKGM